MSESRGRNSVERLDSWKEKLPSRDDELWRQLLLLGIVLAGFRGLFGLVHRIAYPLPASHYYEFSFLLSGLRYEWFLALVVLPLVPLVAARHETSWSRFQYGRELRIVVIAAALPLVWNVIAFEYNFFFQQAYHLDRLIIIALLGLTWLHPLFALPLIIGIFAGQGQLNHPLGFSYTNEQLPRQTLVLFSAFLFIRLRHHPTVSGLLDRWNVDRLELTERSDEYVFVLALGGLIGTSYVIPGVSKVKLLWPFREIVAYHLPWAYVRGWLWQLDPATIERLFEYLLLANPLLTWGTIAIEVGAILLLWRKWGLNVLVASIIGFQLIIFGATGILFKKWFFVLAGFAWAVNRMHAKAPEGIVDRRTGTIVTLLVVIAVLAPMIYPVTTLGWYSSNYEQTYTMEAVDSEGNVHDVSWSQMGPYELLYRQNRFAYVDRNRTLQGEGARTTRDYERVQQLRQITDPEEMAAFRLEHGTVQYDPERAARFDAMLQRYFRHQQCESGQDVVWERLPALPHQFWGQPADPLPSDVEYTHVRIRRTGYLYTDGEIQEVESVIVRTVPIGGCS